MMDQDDMSARIAALSNLSQNELRARFSAHPLTTTADELRDAASAHEPGTLADAREALADAREALARVAWAATDAPSRCACYAPDVRVDVARAYAALTAALPPQDADDDQRCVQRAVDELAERFAQGLTSDAMPSHHVNAAIACIDAGEIAQAIHWLELWWKGAQIAGDREAKPAQPLPYGPTGINGHIAGAHMPRLETLDPTRYL